MRLLTKKETEHALSEEQRSRINEGLKVAKKVENMREAYADLEGKYEHFRNTTISEITSEIEAKRKESEQLDAQIREKQAEWNRLLEPLDRQFALYVKTERDRIEKEQKRLAGEAERLNREDLRLQGAAQKAKKTEESLKRDRIDQELLRNAVQESLNAAKTAEAEAKSEASRLVREASKVREDAENMRIQAGIELQEAHLKRDSLLRKEKELEERELKVVVEELRWYSPVKSLGDNK